MSDVLIRLTHALRHPLMLSAAAALAAGALYAFEKAPANMPFILAVIATLAGLIFLATRKPALSVYGSFAIAGSLTVASAVKYRMKGFDLHVYDFAATGSDADAMRFLVATYPHLIWPFVALVAAAAGFVILVSRLEPRRQTSLTSRLSLVLASGLAVVQTYPLHAGQPRYFHYVGGFNASAFYVSMLDLQYLFRESPLADRLRTLPPQPAFADEVACGATANRPDIVVVLSESQTDPAYFPQLQVGAAFAGSFRSTDGSSHQLQVETFGGGTWVSNFSIMTGLSSADFGAKSPYVTTELEGRVKGALPDMLARCGYRTVTILPMRHNFVNEGPFLESIGFQTVLDQAAIDATEHVHRDEFYYRAAEKFLREHRRTDGRPIFLNIETMFPHSPYTERLAEAAAGPMATLDPDDAEMDEYLKRVLLSQRDFRAFLGGLRKLSTERGTVVLEYGDHHPFIVKPLGDAIHRGNALSDLRSIAYRTYFTVHAIGYDVDMTAFAQDPLDIGFLGASLVQAAKLPHSPLYASLIALRDHCAGRFHQCADRPEVDRHLKQRVDSGMLTID